MTFAENINKAISHKIVLFEYDLPIELSTLINYEAGIWFTKLTPGVVEVSSSDGSTGYYENQNTRDYRDVGTVRADDVLYEKTSSLSELRATNESFYYNQDTTELFFHFDQFNWPTTQIINVGVLEGFTAFNSGDSSLIYDGKLYDPRIKSIGTLMKEKDPLFFGKLSFSSTTVTLINEDGKFDDFKDLNLFRQGARIKLGFEGDDYSEFNQIFEGFIEGYSYSQNDLQLTLQDVRKRFTRTIPTNYTLNTVYPYIKDSDLNKVKPIAYGQVRNSKVICVNTEEPTPATYDFLLMDTEYYDVTSVSAAYKDGVEIDSVNYTLDASNGLLKIDSSEIADNELTKVTVDFIGAPVTNGVSIIQDLLEKYASVSFNSTNYDTLEWNIAKVNSRFVGLCLNREKKIIDAIEEILNAIDGTFFDKVDGRLTLRLYDPDRTPVKTLREYEWISEPTFKSRDKEFLSSVKIGYSKDHKENDYMYYLNKDYEDAALRKYKSYQQKTIETILQSETDALQKSELIMTFSSDVKDVVTRTTKTQNYNIEIGDFIVADPDKRVSGEEDFDTYEVIGKVLDVQNFTVTLSMQKVAEFRETITQYMQGIIYYPRLYGHRLHSATEYRSTET